MRAIKTLFFSKKKMERLLDHSALVSSWGGETGMNSLKHQEMTRSRAGKVKLGQNKRGMRHMFLPTSFNYSMKSSESRADVLCRLNAFPKTLLSHSDVSRPWACRRLNHTCHSIQFHKPVFSAGIIPCE